MDIDSVVIERNIYILICDELDTLRLVRSKQHNNGNDNLRKLIKPYIWYTNLHGSVPDTKHVERKWFTPLLICLGLPRYLVMFIIDLPAAVKSIKNPNSQSDCHIIFISIISFPPIVETTTCAAILVRTFPWFYLEGFTLILPWWHWIN